MVEKYFFISSFQLKKLDYIDICKLISSSQRHYLLNIWYLKENVILI
jgi:hypothetical protein